ncbi:MAG: 3-dehydroquinate synthase [Candidatus Saganbacteria bacterium]|nr:3-dehydroquinate synthase [Candidatus Saganbacteria bacterium]
MDRKIRVNFGERSYDIVVGRNILGKLASYIKGKQVVIVSDPLVNKLYGSKINIPGAKKIIIPRGEKNKSLRSAEKIWNKLASWKISRDATIIALGGGVICDLAAFVAATYMRGINLIHVPTTLLAQVDASIGGKTGVDHPKCKNMIGTFYQPKLVYIDTETLKTLPKKEIKNGMAEIIKYGVIRDHHIIELLENNSKLPQSLLQELIADCASIKAAVVSRDERELKGERMVLNFGHTVGHAIESLTGYKGFSHGEAVAVGMIAAAVIAVKARMLDPDDLERLWNIIAKTGLPTYVKKLSPQKILNAMLLDKKVRAGKINLVLPERIGSVVLRDDIKPKIILEALGEFICK